MNREVMSYGDALEMLAHQPVLSDAVGIAAEAAELSDQHRKLGCICAGQLYASGWIQSQTPTTESIQTGGWKLQTILDEKASDAIKSLQISGVLPSGLFAWVLAFALRQAMSAFISALLRQWFLGSTDE